MADGKERSAEKPGMAGECLGGMIVKNVLNDKPLKFRGVPGSLHEPAVFSKHFWFETGIGHGYKAFNGR